MKKWLLILFLTPMIGFCQNQISDLDAKNIIKENINQNPYPSNYEIKIRSVNLNINSSLWDALIVAEASPVLISELSLVFPNKLKKIQKGDHIKVIYEEIFLWGKFRGVGRILSSSLFHDDKNYFAFYFQINQNNFTYLNEYGIVLDGYSNLDFFTNKSVIENLIMSYTYFLNASEFKSINLNENEHNFFKNMTLPWKGLTILVFSGLIGLFLRAFKNGVRS